MANSSPSSAPETAPALTPVAGGGDGLMVNHQVDLCEKGEAEATTTFNHGSSGLSYYLMAKKKEADVEKDLKKEERCNKAFALQEERIKLEREKFEFQRELEEDKIMALYLSTMTYEQQQYYEDRKNKILVRRANI
ncbi:hypothetical protein PVAP13_9KG330100 [Panicum virgatum]|uniref:No apical meristem-associated C-terminal domain-containing protein n=1 Tax=Panicum virgatum TaxID=38727 RepID=A0A8T0NV09_PANVG|nr:hypothetical protein PVAP13_9KG330100 [Panicum virgatum]